MAATEPRISETISSAVAARLREAIRTGKLEPGARLRQSDIADQYSVSTTPVREAFMMLEREGLLTRQDHRGVVVFRPSVDDLREIYLIRIPLEVLAAKEGVPNLTPIDLERMAEILAEIRDAPDSSAGAKLNDEFHGTIYRAARLPRLVQLINQLRSASAVYIKLHRVFDPSSDTDSEHRAILAACVAGDAESACAALEKHLLHTFDVVAEGLLRDGLAAPAA